MDSNLIPNSDGLQLLTSSFLLLVVRCLATSSVLATGIVLGSLAVGN